MSSEAVAGERIGGLVGSYAEAGCGAHLPGVVKDAGPDRIFSKIFRSENPLPLAGNPSTKSRLLGPPSWAAAAAHQRLSRNREKQSYCLRESCGDQVPQLPHEGAHSGFF